MPIYITDLKVYKSMNYLDLVSSAFLIIAGEKILYQTYVLATIGTSGLHYTSILWAMLLLA